MTVIWIYETDILTTSILLLAVFASGQTDAITTSKGILEIHPVYHGSFWMNWNNLTIAVDPYGGADRFREMGKPCLLVITDIHGDHMDSSTLVTMDLSETVLITPRRLKSD